MCSNKIEKPTWHQNLTKYLQERLLLDKASLQKIILGFPAALTYSIDNNIVPKLNCSQWRLQLDEKSLQKVILGAPSIISSSFNGNIAPKFFYKEGCLVQTTMKLIAEDHFTPPPDVLTYSIENNIALKMIFWRRGCPFLMTKHCCGRLYWTSQVFFHAEVKIALPWSWTFWKEGVNKMLGDM